jgi:dUTP pyrophosphatase
VLHIPIINQSNNPVPSAASIGAAGYDLCAFLDTPVILAPLQRALIPTGISVAIPVGYEGQVRPRSGLAFNHGITILNSPGTIDSDYRGQIQVIMINFGTFEFKVTNGMRIAQLVIAPIAPPVIWEISTILPTSERGSSGFGSTGC